MSYGPVEPQVPPRSRARSGFSVADRAADGLPYLRPQVETGHRVVAAAFGGVLILVALVAISGDGYGDALLDLGVSTYGVPPAWT